MSRGRRKLGLGGWALNGGLYCSGLPGSGWGCAGAASLVLGATRFLFAMGDAPTPEIRANLFLLFVLASLAGSIFFAIGYGSYAASMQPRGE
jgi:hypothetical protein